MTTPQVLLPVDLTGANVTNLVNDEYQQITGGARAIIRPNYGAYYKDSLRLYTVSGGNQLGILNYALDYICSGFNAQATIDSGKDVYDSIIVLNPNLTSIFSLTYQAYGGIDNVNRPVLYSLAEQVGLGAQTPWHLLYNVPSLFTPVIGHKHDIADVYGMEVVAKSLTSIQNEIVANQSNAKYVAITTALKQYVSAQEALITGLAVGVRDHIDRISNQHNYTPGQLGLGDLTNYSFAYTMPNGVPTSAYAGPDTISYFLTNRPTYVPSNHPYLQTNPHDDTTHQIGLGKLANLGMTSTYSLGTQQYSILLADTSTQVYLAPYALVNAIDEMVAVEYGTTFQQVLTNVVNGAQDVINQSLSTLTTASGFQATLDAAVTALTTGRDNVEQAANQSADMDAKYNLLYGNAIYAATVSKIMDYEYTNHQTNASVTADGYWDAPNHIGGLVMWLDANYSENVTFSDMNGNLRLMHLVDRSGSGAVFSADQPANAPIVAMSYDRANNLIGITNADVMHFKNGYCLTQSAGPTITIAPGMTIIALLKTAEAGSMLGLLVNANNPTGAGIYGFTPDGQSLLVSTGDSWSPLVAPDNSISPNTSSIVVGSISASVEKYCWLGSTTTRQLGYPRGTNTPDNSWPTNYIGLPLTQIGIPNYAINNQGEIGSILIYNRQLSMAEAKAVVGYLTLRYTLNTAMAVDYTALSAF